jgi:uncharacterized membrane protein (UPF0127 family)
VRLLLFASACLFAAACQETSGLPAPDEEFVTFPAGASVDDVLKAVDGRPGRKEGLATHGHESVFFAILRDGERHGTSYRQDGFHVVIGAGVSLPEGALVVRRVWAASGQVDGVNEQPERFGVSVAVEPGAAKPYSEKILAAAATFVEALARRTPLHPDCVLAMGEVAYTNPHDADAAERDLAKAARERVPVPAPEAKVRIRTAKGEAVAEVERRHTSDAIEVGMMFRTRFDGENRGMLFEYPHADYRRFWMRNCRIPIDVAYIHKDTVEEIHAMEPGFGVPGKLPFYPGKSVANVALEMPAGWFEKHGVKPGDKIAVEVPPKGK